jgi:hypothetical protein
VAEELQAGEAGFFFFLKNAGMLTIMRGRRTLDMIRSRLGKKKRGKVSWAACLSRKALAIHFVMGMG